MDLTGNARLACATAWMVAIAAGAMLTPSTHAAVIVTVQQVGDDVVWSGGGTLDISAGTLDAENGVGGPTVIADTVFVVGVPGGFVDAYALSGSGFSGPSSIGPGTNQFFGDSGTDDLTGVGFAGGLLAVPTGYVSGDPLTSTATYLNHSFASLGLAAGTYTWTWNTDTGSDSYTLNILPVPEPASAAMLMLIGSTAMLSRRRNQPDQPAANAENNS